MKKLYLAFGIVIGIILSIALAARASTILFPTGGGTGWGNIKAHSILIGNDTGRISTTSPSTSGYVLTSNGVSADPTFQAVSGGGTGLSTTSPLSGSNLLVYKSSGAGSAYGVATSTLTATSPLTGSFTHVGSTGSLGCQTASGSQAGCLSATDWTTFNSKQASISTTWPISLSGATVGWSGLSTTSQPTAGQLLYSNGVHGLIPISTSTMNIGGSAASVVHSLSNDGATLTGTSFNGSATVSNWAIDLTHSNTWSAATTTFTNAVQIGATAANHLFTFVAPSKTYSTSVSVGGAANMTFTNSNNGLYLYTAGTGTLLSIDCNQSTMSSQCIRIQSSDTANSVFNIQGEPSGLGIFKVSSLGDQGTSGAILSLDSSTNANTGQGIFLKSNATGLPLNIVNNSSSKLFQIDPHGNSTTTGYIEVNGNATSTFAKGIKISGGCFAIGSTCIGGSGTVTSVAATVPTGLSISGSPITTSGTLAFSLTSGYIIPLSASTTNWNTFYNTPSNRITAGTNLSWSGNTLNATGGSGGSGTVATSSSETSGYIPFWTTTSATPAKLSGGTSNFVWDNSNARLGIGTGTPKANVAINAGAQTVPYFAIGSTTSQVFSISPHATALIGIGTSSPYKMLAIGGSVVIGASSAGGTLGSFYLPGVSGILKSGTGGLVAAAVNGTDYTKVTAVSCTNQVLTAFTAAGVGTCASVSNAMLANSTISGVALGSNLFAHTHDSTLSGTSYNGSAAVSDWGLNLAQANTWSALQTFGNASTTQLSAASQKFYVDSTGKITGYDTTYAHSGQVSPLRPITLDISTSTTWTGTSTTGSLYGDMAAGVVPFTGTITKASCFTNTGTLVVELTSGSNSTYLTNASTTAGINTFSLSIAKGDKFYLQAGHAASSAQRVNCTFMGWITP